MKIAYFIESLYNMGGMERVLCLKANYLADVYGYDVTVFTFFQFDRAVAFDFSDNVTIIHLDFEKSHSKKNFFLQYLERRTKLKSLLSNALMHEKFDIVISTEFGPEFLFLPFIKDKSTKIAEYHFTYDLKKSSVADNSGLIKIRYFLYYLPWYLAARAYKKFVVLTKSDDDNWRKILNNTAVIGNPISESTELSTLSYKNCVAVGRLSPEKGFSKLITMWKKISVVHPDWKLRICGEGSERTHLEKLISSHELHNSVELLGSVHNIGYIYKNSSLFLMTSEYEGFGLVLAEAMSYGLPCIAFNCNYGPAEIIDHGVNGFLISQGDETAFITGVNQIINDFELRQSFGMNAKKKSRQYSLDTIMSKWKTLFLEVSTKED